MDTKQVIVMRTDLGMRKGKMIAQGAHASMAFLTRKPITVDDYRGTGLLHGELTVAEVDWMKNSYTKICVRVDSLDELIHIHEAALECGLVSHLITDSGKTEFDGVPTITCCAIGPDDSELINHVTGHLKLL